ncbi:MAG: UDP-N-acetylmuramate dehydrogenase [Patescibacteria group bacterium]
MLKILKRVSLAPYTSLKIGPAADFFAIVKTKEDLLEAIFWAKKNKYPIFILGGGSNVLITKPLKALVIKNEIKGIKRKSNYLTALSGEMWSHLVHEAVKAKLYGAENLFLIPGTVGAAPMQNIGAYGVELKDVFHFLTAINLKTGQEKIFDLADCAFAYRHSIFKSKLKGRYFIYSVTLKLSRRPQFKLDYGSIRGELESQGIKRPQAKDVIRAIEKIRNSKLPNPAVLPNAGSFFQNPSVDQKEFARLVKLYPDIKSFPGLKGRVKIPAGWLIEKAGFKGKTFGPVRMYEKQALVLVNQGGASAQQVLGLMKRVQKAVKKKFGLDLQAEVNII